MQLVTRDCEPSYPGSGAHAQLLGRNSKQQIVTLTTVMCPHADGTYPSGYKPVTIDLSKTQKNIPCIEVTRSVGYFDIPMYYEIHREGVKDEDEAPHNIDTAHVPIVYFTAQSEDSSHIKLYTTIDENVQNAITLKISKMSKVKFLYATYKDGCGSAFKLMATEVLFTETKTLKLWDYAINIEFCCQLTSCQA